MPLANLVKQKLVTCLPDASICEVAALMKDQDVGAVVVVVEGNRPIGIITDRDLVLRCLAESDSVAHLAAQDVMTKEIQTISDEEGIFDVVRKMNAECIRRLPIVNDSGAAVGLLSFDDVFELVAEEIAALKKVIRPVPGKLMESAA